MKNLFLLGSLSFSLAFSLGLVVEKNVSKSVAIGGIATISTLGSAFVLDKTSINITSKKLKNTENKVLTLNNQKQELLQLIESKTQSKQAIESEYNAIVSEVNNLKEELVSLDDQRINLEKLINNLKIKQAEITETITVQPEVIPREKIGIYNCILEGLKNSGDFYNPKIHQTFENYLESLQQFVKKLRKSYGNSRIEVDYSDPLTQAAYLIAYYGPYVDMDFEILKMINNQNLFQNIANETLEICLFASGPCPEMVGLGKFLSEQNYSIKRLIINTYDIASKEWSLSLNLNEKFVMLEYWLGNLTLNSNYIDLCQSNSFYSFKRTIQTSKIFIFQNCLNEIYNVDTVQDNLHFLLDQISPESVIIIIDLSNYPSTKPMIDNIKKQASNRGNFEIYCPQKEQIQIRTYAPLPEMIKRYLLTGKNGLIPRKNINCLFIALRKIS